MAKYAVISDIHGNYKALEAFLAYIKQHPVDGIICLGDYVTDSPYPRRTMELLYGMWEQYPCFIVRGNREEYLLENRRESRNWKISSSSGMLYYTALHLTEKDMDFFENLPQEREVILDECVPVYICHGVPGKPRGNVTFEENLRVEALEGVPQRYVFGGHSHRQEIFCHHGKVYLNPGSLGLAIDGVGCKAQFAVFTADSHMLKEESAAENCIELFSIPYDVEGFLRDFAESGIENYGKVLAKAIQKTLVTGVNFFLKSIQEVEKESSLSGVPMQEISESVWQEAARRLNLC